VSEARAKDGNLSIPLYVAPKTEEAIALGDQPQSNLPDAIAGWLESSKTVRNAMESLLK
jgi:hypothetical protein